MRYWIGVTIASALLGSCQSNEQLMAEAREGVAKACRDTAPAGLDVDRYCNCVVERSVGSQTLEEMTQMNREEGEALGASAARECLAQVGTATSELGAAPAEETGEVQDATSDAVGEAAEEAE